MADWAGGLLSTIGRAGAGGFQAYGEAAQDKIDAAKEAAIAKRQATRDKILAGYGMEQAKFTAGERAKEGLLERGAIAEEGKLERAATAERDRLKRENELEIARLKESGEDPETKKLQLQVIEKTQTMISEGASLPQINEYRATVNLPPLGRDITGVEEGGFFGADEPITELRPKPQPTRGEISGGTSTELSQALEDIGVSRVGDVAPSGMPEEKETPPKIEEKEAPQLEINPELPEDLKQWNVQDLQDEKGQFQHMAFIPGRREPIILSEEEYQYWIRNRAPEREMREPWRGGLLSPYKQ